MKIILKKSQLLKRRKSQRQKQDQTRKRQSELTASIDDNVTQINQ